MANRVYLFTVNKIPTIVGGEGFKNVGGKALYEYPWGTTIVSDILTGARFIKQVPSLLWKETTAAISDFNEGLKLLTATLPPLIEVMQGAKLVMDKSMLQNMQMVLNKQRGRFILTEFTELASMRKDKPKQVNKLNNKMTKDAVKFAMDVKRAVNQRNEKKKLQNFIKVLEKHKRFEHKDMGLLGFTTVTYYGP